MRSSGNWFSDWVEPAPRPAPIRTGSVAPPAPGLRNWSGEPKPASPFALKWAVWPPQIELPPMPPPATGMPPAAPEPVVLVTYTPLEPLDCGAPPWLSPRTRMRAPDSMTTLPVVRTIAAFLPRTRTVTPFFTWNERNSKTTAVEPSVELMHVLRVPPVSSTVSVAGSKSSGLPSFAWTVDVVQPTGPFELSGPEDCERFAPLSLSPAKSRKPCAFEIDRAVLTSPVLRLVRIGTSPSNSN